MIAFLPLVSASSGRSVRKERNSSAVSNAPVRITPVDARVADQRAPSVVLVHLDQLQHLARHPGLPQRLGDHRAAPLSEGGRLQQDGRPGGERREHRPPAGIATGKFHGGVTTVSFDGTNAAPSTASSSFARSA